MTAVAVAFLLSGDRGQVAGEQFREAKQDALVIVGVQVLVAVLAGLLGLLIAGTSAAAASFSGGMIGALASLFMVWKVFARGPGTIARQWMAGLLLGELFKFGVTVALFIIAIALYRAAFMPLILGYIATFLAYWIGLLRISSRRRG